MTGWTGRVDALDGEAGRRWHQAVDTWPLTRRGVALVGFACDEGVRRNQGRLGAAEGPAALRAALGNLALHHDLPMADCGTHEGTGREMEATQATYAACVAEVVAAGSLAVGLGGGHEIAWGSFSGLAQATPTGRLGVLNIDAHFDMRSGDMPNSGTNFRQIAEWAADAGREVSIRMAGIAQPSNTRALFETARRHGVEWWTDEKINAGGFAAIEPGLRAWLDGVDAIYLSICLDVFPAAMAPGVSAPAGYGVAPAHVLPILDCVAGSGKLRVADVAELCPRLDIDGRTARLAARLIYQIVQGYASCQEPF